MRSRSLRLSLVLTAATIATGVIIRFVPLGLPWFLVKYGGSTLWALMVYWIASAILRDWRIPAVALIAASVATVVECLKLYHSPAWDAFRLTRPGILLLGRIFSIWDILAYWLAICVGALIDVRIRLSAESDRSLD